MTTDEEGNHERSEEEWQLYQCANCGKPYTARLTTGGNTIVAAESTGCGRCGGEHFVPYETADTGANPS